MTTCEKCGVELQIGDFPFCPHGSGFSRVNGDECDYWDMNLGPEPVHIRSWSQRRQIMAEKGLHDTGRYVKPPDGAIPNPQGPSDWSQYRDMRPDTLEWIARMLATGKGTKAPEEPPLQVTTYISDLSPEQLESMS